MSSSIRWRAGSNAGQYGAPPPFGFPVAAKRDQYFIIWAASVNCGAVNGGAMSRYGILPNTYCNSVVCASPSGKLNVMPNAMPKSFGGLGSLNSVGVDATLLRDTRVSAARAGSWTASR